MIKPIRNNGIQLWWSIKKCSAFASQRCQNKALRMIFEASRYVTNENIHNDLYKMGTWNISGIRPTITKLFPASRTACKFKNWNIWNHRYLYNKYSTVRKIQPTISYSGNDLRFTCVRLGSLLNNIIVWIVSEYCYITSK